MSKTNPSTSIEGKPMSGFRDYPQQGFQIQPASNYWEGNNFIMPGINPSGPAMTSDLAQRFPGLASILSVPSPPPFGGGPFVGAASSPVPQLPDKKRQNSRPLSMLLQNKG